MAGKPINRSEMTFEQLQQAKKNDTAVTENGGTGMSKDHSEVLALILKSEGGLNENEPAHVGGVSYAGITQKTYDGWKSTCRKGSVPESVRNLGSDPQIVNAFYIDYFERYHTWELPEFLQYIYADFVVNAGSAAVKIIQRMVEVEDDGAWGSGTSKAVDEWKDVVEMELDDDPNVDNELITQFHEQKLAHYNNLAETNPDKFGQYLAGWKRRCNNVLSDLGEYFENDEPTPKALDENEPEQQAADIMQNVNAANAVNFSETPTIQLLEDANSILQELARRCK